MTSVNSQHQKIYYTPCVTPILGMRFDEVAERDKSVFLLIYTCIFSVMILCLFWMVYLDIYFGKFPENKILEITFLISTGAFLWIVVCPYHFIYPVRMMIYLCWVFWKLAENLVRSTERFAIDVFGLIQAVPAILKWIIYDYQLEDIGRIDY